MSREEVTKIMYKELDNQPIASQHVKDSYSTLDGALNDYINAIQEDAFYFGYMTAMKNFNQE